VSQTKFHEEPRKIHWAGLLLEGLTVPGLAVLDLGCGRGYAARYFCELHEYVGVDNKEDRIDDARRLHPEGAYFCANYTRLELPPAVADAVLAVETFHYVRPDRVEPTVRHIATWLRPGGYFLTYTGRRDAPLLLEEGFMDEIGLRAVERKIGPRLRDGRPKSLWLLAQKADRGQPGERRAPLAELVAEAAAAAPKKRSRRAPKAVARAGA
jgi:SAM-dependent methyltransferase